MKVDFESLLREAAATKVPDEYGDLLVTPFSVLDRPASESKIEAAERRRGTTLPTSFKLFLQVLGSGNWSGAGCVSAADEVGAFPPGTWEMSGFIAIVQNVRGVGDHLAFNPADPKTAGERPVYYCGHDPLGYARVADSFELWVRATLEAARSGDDFYAPFDDAVSAKWKVPLLSRSAGGSSGVDRRGVSPLGRVAGWRRRSPQRPLDGRENTRGS